MTTARKTTILALLALLSFAALGSTAVAAKNNKDAVKKGVKWIRGAGLSQFPGTGFQSDTLSALVAAKKAGAYVPTSSRERFLKAVREDANSYAQTAGSAAKVMMAAVAGGENPRCFGPSGERTDFYDVLMSEYHSSRGQFGTSAFDHALALIALKASHIKVPSKAVKFAKSRRGKYGWGFALSKKGGDDVESTALMIEGLRAAGVKKSDGSLKAAMRWITYQRNTDGGYNPTTAKTPGETQADTTAYAIRAADSMGAYSSLMKRAKRALRALQQNSGAFRAQPSANSDFHGIATGNAVLALAGGHYPVVVRKTTPAPCS